MIIQAFDLNLIPEQSPVVVHCDQYDKGTGRLVVSLYEGSTAYTPSGTAIIQGTKPDGKGFLYNATLSGNTVTANLTEQMSAVAGRVRCQIVVTESTGRTGTFVFMLDVQRSALPADTDMSESDYQLIEQAIEDCQQAVSDAEDAADDAEAWAVGERGGVPVPSTDPTYQNNAEYWAQVASQHAQGGLTYRGSCLFANIPTTGMVDGDMWNIEDDFTTDSRFQEGAGKEVYAGTNIAWNSNDKWDVLAVQKVGVQSFNGRTGIVTPQSGDYDITDLGDVSSSSPQDNDGLFYNSSSQKYENKPVPLSDMTSSAKGIGKPDGKTTEVSSGTFSAVGVSIPADINSGGTQYGSNWLYYAGTSEVITPSTKQNYRVNDSGTMKLYYWTGSVYAELTSGGGGGGGMNTDGSNAAASVGMTNTKVFTIGDRSGKSATGTEAVELGSGANATGFGSYAEGSTNYSENKYTSLSANQTTETLKLSLPYTTYPYWAFSFLGTTQTESNIQAAINNDFTQDITLTSGGATVRITVESNTLKVYYTNTSASAVIFHYGYASRQNIASGKYAHVEGVNSSASGYYSHAEGRETTAGGSAAHSEGYGTSAGGAGAHAEGTNTNASGNHSHAEGYHTTAQSADQHVSGKYNVADSSDVYAVIVGNGTSTNDRSNALTLDWSGNLETAGDVKNGNGVSLDGLNTVSTLAVSLTGWTSDTTSQSGTTLYKKQISLSHVYTSEPSVDIGAGTGYTLPTSAEQTAYDLIQYCTVDDTVPCLYLYASAIPTTAFYIKVKGVD